MLGCSTAKRAGGGAHYLSLASVFQHTEFADEIEKSIKKQNV